MALCSPKKWFIDPQNENYIDLANQLNLSPLLAKILYKRGYTDRESAQKFLSPRLAYLKDPFDIPNIHKAAQRVIDAINQKENILVYGDYDVDGVTATQIILETLKYLSHDPSHYIPYRYTEGYSLNEAAIKKAKDDKINLIITVDCGISSHKEIALAKSYGIDVIVTDHHNLPHNLPGAHAIVNPKMIQTDHPSKNLSGAGVAFKFVWALLRLLKIKDNSFLTNLLDLTALGTIADVVPLTDENRILAVSGLTLINKKKRVGIKHLIEAASIDGQVSIHNVNFALSPRINAAGRLEHASLSLNLLGSHDPAEAQEIAKQLNAINSRRQKIGQLIYNEAVDQIERMDLRENKVIVLKGNNWHPGVIGIVASKIAEKYSRPTILIGIKEEVCRGSARSVNGLDVFALLNACRDLFNSFGGHRDACGFELNKENADILIKQLISNAKGLISDIDLVPRIKIDAEIDLTKITLSNVSEIELLAPFGESNPAPIFISKNVRFEDFRGVGSNKQHLKAKIHGIDLIGFDFSPIIPELSLSKEYDILYNLDTNEWNGFENIQLKLRDIKESI